MKKKIAVLVTAVALVALVAIGATFALFTDSHSTLNTVTMGNVKITLTEPQFSEDTDNTNTIANVVPRQVIDKDPTIENVCKNDAYVRVLLAYEGLTETQSQEVEALLDIDGENWIKGEDGYYYYQNILAAGADPIVLFTKLTVPDWGNEINDTEFKVNITAEAVQSDYFDPSEEDGSIISWGDVQPE